MRWSEKSAVVWKILKLLLVFENKNKKTKIYQNLFKFLKSGFGNFMG